MVGVERLWYFSTSSFTAEKLVETSRTSKSIPLSERKASATWQGGQPGWLYTTILCFCMVIRFLSRLKGRSKERTSPSSGVVRLGFGMNENLEELGRGLFEADFQCCRDLVYTRQ